MKVWKLRYRIYAILTFFILVFLGVLLISLSVDYNHSLTAAQNVSEDTGERVYQKSFKYLDEIRQYYISASKDKRVTWFLENNMTEKSCEEILAAAKILAGNQLMNDRIQEYALVNYSNRKVLSQKGFFRVRELINGDEIENLYEFFRDSRSSYWVYRSDGTQSDILSPDYRLTVDTRGINLGMVLPLNSRQVKALLLVQINENGLYQVMKDELTDVQDLVLLNEEGDILYSTNDQWNQSIEQNFMRIEKNGVTLSKQGVNRTASMFSLSSFGWKAVILTTLEPMSDVPGFRYVFLLLMLGSCIAFLISFFIFSYLRPMEQINQIVEGSKAQDLKDVADHVKAMQNREKALSEQVREHHESKKELDERKLLHGELLDSQISSVFLPYSIFSDQCYVLLCMTLHRRNEEIKLERDLEKSTFSAMWKDLSQRYSSMSWYPIYVRSAFWTLVEGKDRAEVTDRAHRYIRNLEEYFFERKQVFLNTGVSDIHSSPAEFQEAMSESIYAMNRFTGSHSIDSSHITQYGEVISHSSNHINAAIEQKIDAVVVEGGLQEAQQIWQEYFSSVIAAETNRSTQMVSAYRFVSTLSNALIENGLHSEEMFGVPIQEVFRTLGELYDPVKMRRYVKYNLIETAWSKLTSIQGERNNLLLKQIEGLLEKNKGNITLTEISDALEIPPSTVWKALKMEEGKTFSEYQEKYKLDRACRLLVETDLLVSEIASELGYTNAQNFIRFFSKVEGMTPGNYRKKYKQ